MHREAKYRRVLIELVTFLAVMGVGYSSETGSGITNSSFVTRWNTDVTGGKVETKTNQLKLPLGAGGTYDFVVDWGDGNKDRIGSYYQAQVTHTYATPGEYEVTITGICEGFGFGNFLFAGIGDRAKLSDVRQWGSVKLHNEGYQFAHVPTLRASQHLILPI